MSPSFGPQLIGETEKTLSAVLRRHLQPAGLTESQWVTLRLADLGGAPASSADLAATVADRAHVVDARAVVSQLTDRGLLNGGSLTAAGRMVLVDLQAAIAGDADPIWRGLPDDDVAAADRVLREVIRRARAVLARPAPGTVGG